MNLSLNKITKIWKEGVDMKSNGQYTVKGFVNDEICFTNQHLIAQLIV